MTEKRSDYRKKIKHKQERDFLHTIKSAFAGDDQVDVNPDFKREPAEANKVNQQRKQREHSKQSKTNVLMPDERAVKLKKKLNHAIILTIGLIILVLLALFHL
ncbi:hypothetical protein OZY43_03780 [Lactobacillus sp. ESL0785]|uniref:hypothetical protein n=1 Tax=Lactobacillus sp. ESL0785 TaxID=2983232 RepID=UPI0023F6A71C|nr:hypothetical protein [Lactobacillus sp. ESL0785]WEV71531.1 hypothetical protein OZY43_03780 [Lactobacillus sp. ESL0785]